ncbi:hypothetical protein HELRODRAFT_158017 [Helobdella robusta]|uniref:Actin-related protein 6 n=1 Tax=Helobdella robusta TaxID=6412 RepID=T1EMI7_HELRO|nr:hypothetical protein HELRODRAFT_158017 [Helobdella robusta]ESN92061.1 hypothetical protein HELRODRAFT_158017 [Helobdella robusta]
MTTVMLDNGAYTAKVGYISEMNPKIIPNCVIKAKTVRNRIFIGNQIDECKDLSGLYFLLAFQKGYLTNWEIEKQVWDHMFGKNELAVNFEESGFIVTESYLNFKSIQESIDEIFFEEYQVPFLFRCNPSYLIQYKQQRKKKNLFCCLVVDSGYSYTHVVPYHNGRAVKMAMRRISIGGKILTNHLKEVISYRQLMVMDETHVINQLKEDTCFVSQDFYADMNLAKQKGPSNKIALDYVLPDYAHIKRGHIKEPDTEINSSEQIIRVCNERFSIPELLFHPSDIGIHEMGIPEAIAYVIGLCPEELQPFLYLNIILTGGNSCLPGFRERVFKDLRTLAPDHFEINVRLDDSPIQASWQGGCLLGNSPDFTNHIVTKDQFDEHGVGICQEMFNY